MASFGAGWGLKHQRMEGPLSNQPSGWLGIETSEGLRGVVTSLRTGWVLKRLHPTQRRGGGAEEIVVLQPASGLVWELKRAQHEYGWQQLPVATNLWLVGC